MSLSFEDILRPSVGLHLYAEVRRCDGLQFAAKFEVGLSTGKHVIPSASDGEVDHIAQKIHCGRNVVLDLFPLARVSKAIYPAKVLYSLIATSEMQCIAINAEYPSGR